MSGGPIAASSCAPRKQPTTLANPPGLTPRQAEILDLDALERSNAEIAGQLHLWTRTVDHHVAAVLQRLEVPTRHAAARLIGPVLAPSGP
jgi:DNA-binding NarL/FixJ family response regulator